MNKGSLKSIMGVPDKNTEFTTLPEFTKYLATLNKAKLQDLCMSKGLIPSHERRMMIKALENLFKKDLAKKVRVSDQGLQPKNV